MEPLLVPFLAATVRTATPLAFAALGEQVLPRLYEREIDYLIEHEFAQSATDILWRRTKLGLHLDASAVEVLEAWLSKHVVRRSSSN